MSRTLQPCGTRAARRRHAEKGETCAACVNTRTTAPCGTKQARRRHHRRGETCQDCVAKPRTVQPCGTRAAYRRHKAAEEDPCDKCAAANLAHSETYRRRNGIKSATTATQLIEDIQFLLNAGEGEQRILEATGYKDNPVTLRNRLGKNGRQDLAARIFNQWELAA